MIARKHLIAIAVGVCLLGLSSLSSQKNPVERPWTGRIVGTGVLLPTGAYVGNGTGHLSHLGKCTGHMEGLMGQTLQGFFTAANGDQVWFEMSVPTEPAVITGGTGRFTGATGVFIMVDDESEFEEGADGTVTIHIKHGIEGTITY